MATPLSSRLRTYRRLLGYARGQWHMLLLSVFGMTVDAACVTLFAKLIKPLLDRLFIAKDPTVIFWMPIWILCIFAVSAARTPFLRGVGGRGLLRGSDCR